MVMKAVLKNNWPVLINLLSFPGYVLANNLLIKITTLSTGSKDNISFYFRGNLCLSSSPGANAGLPSSIFLSLKLLLLLVFIFKSKKPAVRLGKQFVTNFFILDLFSSVTFILIQNSFIFYGIDFFFSSYILNVWSYLYLHNYILAGFITCLIGLFFLFRNSFFSIGPLRYFSSLVAGVTMVILGLRLARLFLAGY